VYDTILFTTLFQYKISKYFKYNHPVLYERKKTISKNNGNKIISKGLKVKKVLRATLCLVTTSIVVNWLKQNIKNLQ